MFLIVFPDEEHVFDFSIFANVDEGSRCDGNSHEDCQAVERLATTLDYYYISASSKNGVDDDDKLTSFCDEIYGQNAFLNDYIHWTTAHGDPQSIHFIRSRVRFHCDSVSECGSTARHYRRDVQREDDTQSSWFSDTMASLHFNVFHLEETGLRVHIGNEVDGYAAADESSLADTVLKQMKTQIAMQRGAREVRKTDSSTNSKFVHVLATESTRTKLDALTGRLLKDHREIFVEEDVQELESMLYEDAYDTETLEYVVSLGGLEHKFSAQIELILREFRGV